MHTMVIDTKFVDVTDQDMERDHIKTRFHFNQDLSGMVLFKVFRVSGPGPDPGKEITMHQGELPGHALVEFVGRAMQGKAVSKIEDMSGEDFLRRAFGC